MDNILNLDRNNQSLLRKTLWNTAKQEKNVQGKQLDLTKASLFKRIKWKPVRSIQHEKLTDSILPTKIKQKPGKSAKHKKLRPSKFSIITKPHLLRREHQNQKEHNKVNIKQKVLNRALSIMKDESTFHDYSWENDPTGCTPDALFCPEDKEIYRKFLDETKASVPDNDEVWNPFVDLSKVRPRPTSTFLLSSTTQRTTTPTIVTPESTTTTEQVWTEEPTWPKEPIFPFTTTENPFFTLFEPAPNVPFLNADNMPPLRDQRQIQDVNPSFDPFQTPPLFPQQNVFPQRSLFPPTFFGGQFQGPVFFG